MNSNNIFLIVSVEKVVFNHHFLFSDKVNKLRRNKYKK